MPDPKFNDKIVSKFTSCLMYDGKRSTAEKIVYGAFEVIQKKIVTFQTGYGPSGLPHIGTFGEVLRTNMVRTAFSCLSDIPTRLVCFSDDLDGLRKVPTNIPNSKKLEADLDLP